jgi:hypothetical protein
MNKISLMITSLLWASQSFAIIGDTVEIANQRYGNPTSKQTNVAKSEITYRYKNNNLLITQLYKNRIATESTYLKQNGNFTEKEVENLLQAEGDGQLWNHVETGFLGTLIVWKTYTKTATLFSGQNLKIEITNAIEKEKPNPNPWIGYNAPKKTQSNLKTTDLTSKRRGATLGQAIQEVGLPKNQIKTRNQTICTFVLPQGKLTETYNAQGICIKSTLLH